MFEYNIYSRPANTGPRTEDFAHFQFREVIKAETPQLAFEQAKAAYPNDHIFGWEIEELRDAMEGFAEAVASISDVPADFGPNSEPLDISLWLCDVAMTSGCGEWNAFEYKPASEGREEIVVIGEVR